MTTQELISKIKERSAQRRDIMCEYGDQDSICDLLDEAVNELVRLDDALYMSQVQNSLYKGVLYDDGRG